MSYTITVSGTGPEDDDLRAAFGELVSALRAATPEELEHTLGARLDTGSATYTHEDIPDSEPADDEPDVEA